ncbi:polysaccharide biosynthesis/export family protein [Spirosoma montaniterrae]|uniref:Ligand-binding protein n=1 Tax=Spirosoma montaniterrae TaxID=1178516 RepID=A0A1P9WWB8_9BACT|nr:SLBB domain-containing protein [Spirosoma montaniterrae]AQG79653.1 ligand-binding protein [Spirosoma montaniterrae]
MQNSSVNQHVSRNSFHSVTSLITGRLRVCVVTLLLTATGLAAQAQVAPAPSGGGVVAPSTPAGPASQPGRGTAQPGRGTGLPPGVNTNNLPANVQQQIQQRAAQQQGNNGGRTAPQQADANGDPDVREMSADSLNTPEEAEKKAALEDGYEAARVREAAELRRKLFGSSIFNNRSLATSFQPNLSMATPRNYIVGPGDRLNIRVYGYSEFDFSQTVSPEGNVYIAQGTGIGPIFVSGLSVEQVKTRLSSRLSAKFVGLKSSAAGSANTYLEVSLSGIRSIRVTVTGDALRPGTYTLSSLSTVMNAIYQAGGPNELGSFRKVQLIRNNRVAATLDLYDYLLNGTQRNDLRLQDNDNIRFTTFISRVEITGTVKRINIFEMLPGETLDRLLFYAGDFAANAYKSRIKVTRLTDRERKVIDVAAADFKTFVMQDGDIADVERLLDRFENQVNIEGAVFRPGQYSLDQNKTLTQLIKTAEGLKGDAFVGRINIIRTREDLAIENLTVNLTNILAGTEPDVPLQREDQVVIPSKFELAQTALISVQGEVNRPSSDMPYMANMTLNDALVRAGGMLESAATSQIEVVRRKKDFDPKSTSSQLADIFRFDVSRDLSINADVNRFVLEPFDQIIVRRSPNYAIQTYAAVEGEVIVPGQYAIKSKEQKVSDLITLAGGLTPQAYVEGATLVRIVQLSPDEIARQQQAIRDAADAASTAGRVIVETEDSAAQQSQAIGINMKKILEDPNSSENILVQAGDILRIPKILETVRIQGEVLQPSTVKYRVGQTFQDYISQAGGFTSKSQRRRSFIVYANGSVDRTRKFMFFNIYPRVQPGSEVVVPKRNAVPLTPQQILASTAGTISSLLSVIGLIIALTRVGN